MNGRLRLAAALLGLLFLTGHASVLPQTLEDIDSVNFALGVEDFDVSRHRPHPPGYPVYVAMTKLSTAVVNAVRPTWDRDRRAAVGLAVWSVLAGALGGLAVSAFWSAAGFSPTAALFAAIIAITSPLFWFTAARPLTDTVALVGAVGVQAWLARAVVFPGEAIVSRRAQLTAAFLAGFLIGVRTQTMWLTGPLIAWAMIADLRRGGRSDAAGLLCAAAAGCLVWTLPLVFVSGGPAAYFAALGSQGAEDFAGVEMLATRFDDDLFKFAMDRMFIAPWVVETLAHVVLGLALIGLVRLWRLRPRAVALVFVCYLPALAFHLAFHETETVRYALPFVVPVAGLAVVALTWPGRWVAAIGTAAITVTSLVVVSPRLAAYGEREWPVARVFQDMHAEMEGRAEQPAVQMHREVWWGVHRLLEWYRPVRDIGPQPFPGNREWLGIVEHWRSGNTNPIWFLTEMRRNDLALIEARARQTRERYLLDPGVRDLIGGARLDSLIWTEINRPGWMLGRGWSLTPEIAGGTAAEAPRTDFAEGFVLRRRDPQRMLIGGRAIEGQESDAIVVTLDDRPVAEWPIRSDRQWFVHWLDLPQGILEGDGDYATLRVSVSRRSGTVSQVLFEQFDLAPLGVPMFSFEEGWNELELNPETGVLWRWSSDRSILRIIDGARPLMLTLAGESPLKYFAEAPTVTVRVGSAEVDRFAPDADFSRTIALDPVALSVAQGLVAIELDRAHVPAEHGDTPDRRRLGLRLWTVAISEPSGPSPSTTSR